MAGNRQFIERAKAVEAMVKRNIEEIYSGMCVVLHRRGFADDEIVEMVGELQTLWNEVANTPGANMCDICVELTGIDIREQK